MFTFLKHNTDERKTYWDGIKNNCKSFEYYTFIDYFPLFIIHSGNSGASIMHGSPMTLSLIMERDFSLIFLWCFLSNDSINWTSRWLLHKSGLLLITLFFEVGAISWSSSESEDSVGRWLSSSLQLSSGDMHSVTMPLENSLFSASDHVDVFSRVSSLRRSF